MDKWKEKEMERKDRTKTGEIEVEVRKVWDEKEGIRVSFQTSTPTKKKRGKEGCGVKGGEEMEEGGR